jgi:hypothetical protein
LIFILTQPILVLTSHVDQQLQNFNDSYGTKFISNGLYDSGQTKEFTVKLRPCIAIVLCIAPRIVAEPQLSSWYFGDTGRYARLYESTAAEASQTAVTTWSRNQGTQTLPTYAGIHEVSYDDNWIYIRTTGLGQHIMGPWYLNEAKTQDFPNYPSNTSSIYKIPRIPTTPPATPELTGLGAIGYFVDGVAMFDSRDAFSYSTSSGTDATPGNGVTGDGIWNRDAYVNESVTFDAAYAHQAGNRYHYHANPPALRYLLGGHVDYNATNNVYSEKSTAPGHSPIIGWVLDGYPIYGPYGYAEATNSASSVRRMFSGYEPRTITQRHTLPVWAATAQNRGTTLTSGEYGPDISTTYPLGHYIEDYEYLGNLGYTQGVDFDLNEYNVRWCVTPEFPEGTYAYFTSIEADGTPRYPYNLGRWYYGDPTGAALTAIPEPHIVYAEGGPEKKLIISDVNIPVGSDDIVLVYDSVEGGSYRIEAVSNLISGSSETLASNLVSAGQSSSYTHTNGLLNSGFYKVHLDELAAFDNAGFEYGSPGPDLIEPVDPASGPAGTSINLTITLDADASPPLPPAGVTPGSVTVGGINATSIVRVDNTTVTAVLPIPGGTSTGTVDVIVSFPGPSYTFTDAFTFE